MPPKGEVLDFEVPPNVAGGWLKAEGVELKESPKVLEEEANDEEADPVPNVDVAGEMTIELVSLFIR